MAYWGTRPDAIESMENNMHSFDSTIVEALLMEGIWPSGFRVLGDLFLFGTSGEVSVGLSVGFDISSSFQSSSHLLLRNKVKRSFNTPNPAYARNTTR